MARAAVREKMYLREHAMGNMPLAYDWRGLAGFGALKAHGQCRLKY